MSKFYELFKQKPVIGMVHLGGDFPISQAMNDYHTYQKCGLEGVIVENYHGSISEVEEILHAISPLSRNIKLGVNILGDFEKAFQLAKKYGAEFIQIDSVQPIDINLKHYIHFRDSCPEIVVLGGIGFKYTTDPGSNWNNWLEFAKSKVDAIVTTGSGTGKETPIEKLVQYKGVLNDFPLIEGAGSNKNNVYEHLKIADGVIVGSAYKPDNDTHLPVEEDLIKEHLNEAKKARLK